MTKKFQTEKYQPLLRKMIEETFPILRHRKVEVEEKNFSQTGEAISKLSGLLIIVINPSEIDSKSELKGFFAHELCHLEDFAIGGYLKGYLKILYKSNFCSNYREKYEKETDKKAIKKGYGEELKIMNEKNILSNHWDFSERCHLTPEEIEECICDMNNKNYSSPISTFI